MGGTDYTSTERSRRFRKRKNIDPRVQAYYDALPPDERAELDRKMKGVKRELCDLRWSKTTQSIDKRCFFPRVPVKNHDWGKPIRENREAGIPDDRPDINDIRRGNAGPDLSSGKLKENEDLPAYIKRRLGEGKILADFYLDILASTGKAAKSKGIWMNHRLQAAQWLADRGWGKAKGDEDKTAAIQINVVDYKDADVPNRPKIVTAEVVEDAPVREKITYEDPKPVDLKDPKINVVDFSLADE